MYSAYYKNGKELGYGDFLSANKAINDIQYERGIPNVNLNVLLKDMERVKYEGDLKEYKYHGKGRLLYKSGDKLVGSFSEGHFVEGDIFYRSGCHYNGSVKNL